MKGKFEAIGVGNINGANRVDDEDLKFGDGKVIRDGMGQGQVTDREGAACGWLTRHVSRLWQSNLWRGLKVDKKDLSAAAQGSVA